MTAKRHLVDLPPHIRRWPLNAQEAYAAGILAQQRCWDRAAARGPSPVRLPEPGRLWFVDEFGTWPAADVQLAADDCEVVVLKTAAVGKTEDVVRVLIDPFAAFLSSGKRHGHTA